MGFITIIILALGLCFDSFAVSVSCGMARCSYTTSRGVRFAAVLGLCQMVMPLIGWLLASNFHQTIMACDHWLAFVLLLLIGGKMVLDSLKDLKSSNCSETKTDDQSSSTIANQSDSDTHSQFDDNGGSLNDASIDSPNETVAPTSQLTLKRSLVLGIATSIDSLVAGAVLGMLTIEILPAMSQTINVLIAVFVIGVITFAASFTGLYIGRKSLSKIGNKAELIGGIILIALGVKILIEHLIEH